jgi:hypothetical protein
MDIIMPKARTKQSLQLQLLLLLPIYECCHLLAGLVNNDVVLICISVDELQQQQQQQHKGTTDGQPCMSVAVATAERLMHPGKHCTRLLPVT